MTLTRLLLLVLAERDGLDPVLNAAFQNLIQMSLSDLISEGRMQCESLEV